MPEPVLIWLHPNPGAQGNIDVTVELLQARIIDNVKAFADVDECIDCITDFKNKYVVLIVSCTIEQETIAILHDLPVVASIYIQCTTEKNSDESSCKSLSKYKGSFTDINQMISKISHYICLMEYQTIRFEILNSFSDVELLTTKRDKSERSFTYCLLLREVLSKFNSSNITDMIEYLEKVYQNENCELRKIKELKNTYTMDKAIQSYTKDSIVYKLLNKSLRNNDIETLYFMRVFICHLHQQIMKLQSATNIQESTIKTLYRGQRMTRKEFEELKTNQGKLFYINQFLSTTEEECLAEIYAGKCDENEEGVIFKIKLDQNERSNNVYACVTEFSQYGFGEQEWLFSMGTVFHIEQVVFNDNVWYVDLTLTSDKHRLMEEFMTDMRKSIQTEHPNPAVPLYRLLARMGRYKEAIRLYQKNENWHNDWEIEASVFDMKGLMYSDQHDEEKALVYYLKALKIIQEHADKTYPFLSTYYSNVAISYDLVGEPQLSLDHYTMVVQLERQASSPDYLSLGHSYEAMADISFSYLEKHDQALQYYQDALHSMLKVLPSNHPDVCSVYEEIANVYIDQKLFNKAQEMLRSCVSLIKSSPDCIQHDVERINKRLVALDQLENGTYDDHEDLHQSYDPSSRFDERNLLNLIGAIARSSKDSSAS